VSLVSIEENERVSAALTLVTLTPKDLLIAEPPPGDLLKEMGSIR